MSTTYETRKGRAYRITYIDCIRTGQGPLYRFRVEQGAGKTTIGILVTEFEDLSLHKTVPNHAEQAILGILMLRLKIALEKEESGEATCFGSPPQADRIHTLRLSRCFVSLTAEEAKLTSDLQESRQPPRISGFGS